MTAISVQRSAVKRKVAAYVALTKPRIIELLLVTTVPAMVVAEGGLPDLGLVLATLVGGTLAAGGANATNMYIDRDIDRLMERTKGRPLVTGEVEPRPALIFAVVLQVLAFGFLWLTTNLLAAMIAVGAGLFYIFVYSLWLKRTHTSNIVIGGAAGAAPPVVGWAAVTGDVSLTAGLLFLVVFLWTPPHFWALALRHADDYGRADVPMLPTVASFEKTTTKMVVYALVLGAATVAIWPVAGMGPLFGVVAVGSSLWFLAETVRLKREGHGGRAMRVFGVSISMLTLVFAALAVDELVRSAL